MIMVVSDRFTKPKANYYDRDWKKLDAKGRWWDTFDSPLPFPANHGRMIAVAEALSAGLDFLRVDLYNTGDRIYFGEMEPYPANGFQRWNPKEFDAVLGTYWVGMANYKFGIR